MWVLFSVVACVFSVGNAILNKVCSLHTNSYLSATIKSLFMVIFTFAIVAIFGHIPDLVLLNQTEIIFIIVAGLLTTINWICYFAAIKRSKLDLFAPFNETALLAISNGLFAIFITTNVMNVESWISISLYVVGLLILVVALIYILINKKMNDGINRKWLIFGFLSTTAYAVCLLFVKMYLSPIHADVVSFWQMVIVFVCCAIISIFVKGYRDLPKLKLLDWGKFALCALCNAAFVISRYQAYSYSDGIPSITNIIVSFAFVIVSMCTAIYLKKHEKKEIIIISCLVLVGMLLEFGAGLFIK